MDEGLRRAEIDRLGEAMRERDLTDDEVDLYNRYRDSFLPALSTVLAMLRQAAGPPATDRQKTIWSTAAKLRRSTLRLSQVQDIAGCRVIVPFKQDQDALTERLMEMHADWRLSDRRTRPSHGYRALHVIAAIDGRHVEVQVRTELQHLWAEVSEACDRVYPGVKYGSGPQQVLDTLGVLSGLVARVESAEGRISPEDLEERRTIVRELLNTAAVVLRADVRDFDASP